MYKRRFLSIWFTLGTLVTIILIFPAIFILIYNLNNNTLPSHYGGVSAANIPSNPVKDNDQKTYSNGAKLSFQVMLPGVTLPISEIGYYVMALLLCSVIHEAGHAVAALQEGNMNKYPKFIVNYHNFA